MISERVVVTTCIGVSFMYPMDTLRRVFYEYSFASLCNTLESGQYKRG